MKPISSIHKHLSNFISPVRQVHLVLFGLLVSSSVISAQGPLIAADGVNFGTADVDPKLKKRDGTTDLVLSVEQDSGFLIYPEDHTLPTFAAGEGHQEVVSAGSWYRIAQTPAGVHHRGNAVFSLRDNIGGGGHSTVVFRAGIAFSDHNRMGVTLLSNTCYARTTFSEVRIVDSTDLHEQSYLEVKVIQSGGVRFSITDNLALGHWEPVDWLPVADSVPSTYTARTFTLDNNLFMVGSYKNLLTVERNGDVTIDGSLTVDGQPVLNSVETDALYLAKGPVSNGATFASPNSREADGLNAIAIGSNSLAGQDSFAFGPNAEAISFSSQGSFSFGEDSHAIGGGVALGKNSRSGQRAFSALAGQALGFYSFAIGQGTNVEGKWSGALGALNLIGNDPSDDPLRTTIINRSFILGNESKTRGSHSYVVGEKNTADSNYTYIFGRSNKALFDSESLDLDAAQDSFLIGRFNRSHSRSYLYGAWNASGSDAEDSFAFGSQLRTVYPDEIVLGINSTGGALPSIPEDRYPVFRVGSGFSSNNRADVITTERNGQTTLENRSWDENNPLSDATDVEAKGNALVVNGHTVLNGKVTLAHPQGDISMGAFGGN